MRLLSGADARADRPKPYAELPVKPGPVTEQAQPTGRSGWYQPADQRSNCSTLCCEELASASAETAIDWRVDSAWLLAASSFGSANVRFDAPVCSTLIRLLLKSWRICTTDRFEPSVEASARSELEAFCSDVNTLLVALLSMKSVPTTRLERPRPGAYREAR